MGACFGVVQGPRLCVAWRRSVSIVRREKKGGREEEQRERMDGTV